MSSTVFGKQNPSPAVTRRAPVSNEDPSNRSQRSLSSKLRNLFRKKSPSPNRTTNNDGRPPPAPLRQRSPSPRSGKPSTDAPHLQAPTVGWPFGKKKAKSPSTPKPNKKKNKDNRTPNQIIVPPMEISRPYYEQENQTSIRGQNFVPRTPEYAYNDNGRLQSSSSYEPSTAKGFRDYVVIDQTQPYQQVRTSSNRSTFSELFFFFFFHFLVILVSNSHCCCSSNKELPPPRNNNNNNNNNNKLQSFVYLISQY
jgi:hypothetical protein